MDRLLFPQIDLLHLLVPLTCRGVPSQMLLPALRTMMRLETFMTMRMLCSIMKMVFP